MQQSYYLIPDATILNEIYLYLASYVSFSVLQTLLTQSVFAIFYAKFSLLEDQVYQTYCLNGTS